MATTKENLLGTIDYYVDEPTSHTTTTQKRTKKCRGCGEFLDYSQGPYTQYCPSCTFERMSFDQKAKSDPTFLDDKFLNVDYVVCPICGYLTRKLQNHIRYQHKDLSYADFKLAYPDCLTTCENETQIKSEKLSGDKNPWANHGGKYSPFSTKHFSYTEEQRQEAISKAAENRSYNTTVEYYVAKGMTEDEALSALKERQSTFSLEKCIEKYGEELGTEKWKERQEKWQDTLNSKSDEEIAEINRKKMSGGSISTGEKKLYRLLLDVFDDLQIQKFIRVNSKNYVFDIHLGNKLIEYNGDYWHANPNKYKANDFVRYKNNIQVTASQIWEYDKLKYQAAIDDGFEVLVIWEHDFLTNEQGTLNKCINFLI